MKKCKECGGNMVKSIMQPLVLTNPEKHLLECEKCNLKSFELVHSKLSLGDTPLEKNE